MILLLEIRSNLCLACRLSAAFYKSSRMANLLAPLPIGLGKPFANLEGSIMSDSCKLSKTVNAPYEDLFKFDSLSAFIFMSRSFIEVHESASDIIMLKLYIFEAEIHVQRANGHLSQRQWPWSCSTRPEFFNQMHYLLVGIIIP